MLGSGHRKQPYHPFGRQPCFRPLPLVRTLWIASRAGVGRLVYQRTEATQSYPSAGRTRVLAGADYRNEGKVHELDLAWPSARSD